MTKTEASLRIATHVQKRVVKLLQSIRVCPPQTVSMVGWERERECVEVEKHIKMEIPTRTHRQNTREASEHGSKKIKEREASVHRTIS